MRISKSPHCFRKNKTKKIQKQKINNHYWEFVCLIKAYNYVRQLMRKSKLIARNGRDILTYN